MPELLPFLIAGGVNNAANGIFGEISRSRNYYWNNLAAEKADQRTRALYYDLYSPAAKISQLKAAGLSPSIYAEGALGGSVGTAGAQGEGASGVQNGTYNIDPLTMSQIKLTEAQAENVEADTAKKTAETTKIGAEVDNIIQDTKNKYLQGENEALNNLLKQFEVSLKGETINTEAAIKKQELENLRDTGENIKAATRIASKQGEITEATAKSIIEQERLKVIDISAGIFLKRAQEALTKSNITLQKAEVANLLSQIAVNSNTIRIRNGQLQLEQDKLEAQIKQWAAHNKNYDQDQQIKVAKLVLDFYNSNSDRVVDFIDAVVPM